MEYLLGNINLLEKALDYSTTKTKSNTQIMSLMQIHQIIKAKS